MLNHCSQNTFLELSRALGKGWQRGFCAQQPSASLFIFVMLDRRVSRFIVCHQSFLPNEISQKTKFVDEVFVLLKNKTPQNRPCSYSLRPEGEGCNSLKRSVRSWPQCTINLRRVSAESMRLEGSIIRSWNPSSFFVQIEVSLMSHTVPISAVQWNDSVLHIYTFFF